MKPSCILQIFLKIFGFVQFFPWKIYICTAEMSVSSSLFVDWSSQIKHTNDSCRTKIEVFTNDFYKFCIGKFACSKCVHIDGSRFCYTDCIRKLDFTFVSQSCCNNILCNITCCISCGTVNFCAIFTGESTAAVTSCSTVSINDDLTTCKSTVTMRSTDYKRPVGLMKYFVSSSTISAGMISSNTIFFLHLHEICPV